MRALKGVLSIVVSVGLVLAVTAFFFRETATADI